MSQVAAPTAPWSSRLDIAAKVIALVASFSLAASLLYDWGFYTALNLSFLEVPSVLSDHIRSGLLWFPKVAMSFGAFLLYEMVVQRLEKGMSEDEIIQASSNPERIRRFRDSPQKLITLIAVLVVIGYIIAGDIFLGGLPFGLFVGWVAFSVWAQSPVRILVRRPIELRLAIHLLPPISMWLFFTGYTDAVQLYQPSATVSYITITGTSTPEPVVLLRQLDKGLFVKEKNDAVGFRPWSEIKKIETSGRYTPKKGLFCSWLGVACLPMIQTSKVSEKEKITPMVEEPQGDKASLHPTP